jgi:hypothetical protein
MSAPKPASSPPPPRRDLGNQTMGGPQDDGHCRNYKNPTPNIPGRPTRRVVTVSLYSAMLAPESLVLFSGSPPTPPKKAAAQKKRY